MMEDMLHTFDGLARSFGDRLSARTVYGEPISVNGVTVVPVARVAFGFGGGGSGENEAAMEGGKGNSGGGFGGGGGGGVSAIGYIEITSGGSRWVPAEPPKRDQLWKAATAIAAALPIGGRRGLIARAAVMVAILATQLMPSRTPDLSDAPQHAASSDTSA